MEQLFQNQNLLVLGGVVILASLILAYLLGFQKITAWLLGNLLFVLLLSSIYYLIDRGDKINWLAGSKIFAKPETVEKFIVASKPILGLILLGGTTLLFLHGIKFATSAWIFKKIIAIVLWVPLFVIGFGVNVLLVFYLDQIQCSPPDTITQIFKNFFNVYLLVTSLVLIWLLIDFSGLISFSFRKNKKQPESPPPQDQSSHQQPKFKII